MDLASVGLMEEHQVLLTMEPPPQPGLKLPTLSAPGPESLLLMNGISPQRRLGFRKFLSL